MSQNQSQPKFDKVYVKFVADDSSKEAIEKLKTDQFFESIKEDSKKIFRKKHSEK